MIIFTACLAAMINKVKPLTRYTSLLLCFEVTVVYMLLDRFNAILWIYSPIVFPLIYIIAYKVIDKSVWRWYYLPMHCLFISAYFLFMIKYSSGSHDALGTVLMEMVLSATFLLTFITVMFMRISSLRNEDGHRSEHSIRKKALKPISKILIAFTCSYLLLSYLNYNL